MLKPFLCSPIYQERIWGGRRLETLLGRELPPNLPVGESWEVSSVPGAPSEVEGQDGRTLEDLLRDHPVDLLGPSLAGNGAHRPDFPLLIKYLDANDRLSVQVHPNDEYAGMHENGSPGKSEMWLVLQADPGAEIVAGVNPEVDRETFADALRTGGIEETLQRRSVKTGDVVLMPAGRLHALGAGMVVLEIQQTSDVTYRLHDWGRVDASGIPRELHTERGCEVIDFDDRDEPVVTPLGRTESWGRNELVGVTKYFMTERWTMSGALNTATSPLSPDVVLAVTAPVSITARSGTELHVPRGRSAVVPACVGEYTVESSEQASVVRARVPRLEDGLSAWSPRTTEESDLLRGVCDREAVAILFGEDSRHMR
jgi:mannose-6-phosphate isomerase